MLQQRPQCDSPFPGYQRLGFLPQAREPGAAGVTCWSPWDERDRGHGAVVTADSMVIQ